MKSGLHCKLLHDLGLHMLALGQVLDRLLERLEGVLQSEQTVEVVGELDLEGGRCFGGVVL